MSLVRFVVGFVGLGLAGVTVPALAVDLSTGIDSPAAQDATAPTASGLRLTAGLGVAFAPDYEGSDDHTIAPLWNLRVGNLYHPDTYAQVIGPSLRSNLIPDEHWRFGVSGRYLPDYEDVDDSKVNDIEDADQTFLFGVTLGYDFLNGARNDLALEVDAQYDVAEGNGGVVTPRLRWASPVGDRMAFAGSISGTWASEDYMSNRFGISGSDADQSGLDQYDADAGFKNATITGSLTYRLAERWSVTGLAAFSRLFGDAEDSPIVDDRGDANQLLGGVLVNFTF
jgi:outer membrane protein